MRFKSAEIETALAHTHNIADEQLSAFANRLRNLRRGGFPPGSQAGRGKVSLYSTWDLALLGIVTQLYQLGLSPERAVDVVNTNKKTLAAGLHLTTHYLIKGEGGPIVFWFDPAALSDLMRPSPRGDRSASGFLSGPTNQVVAYLEKWLPNGLSRLAMFNATYLVSDLAAYSVGPARRIEFFADLRQAAAILFPEVKDGST